MFFSDSRKRYYLSRGDVNHQLSSYTRLGFELDGYEWPSVEHYYQGMKFEDAELRESIRATDHPDKAKKLADANKGQIRQDWPQVREVMMTRGVYIKCRTHEAVATSRLSSPASTITSGVADVTAEVTMPSARC